MSKLELAMLLIELTGAKAAMMTQMKATMDQMKKLFESSPLAAMGPSKTELAQFLGKAEKSAPEILQQFAVLYSEYFTYEELKGMVEFYQSPVGQSMITKLPGIMAASQVIGTAWANKLTNETVELLRN